MPQSERVRGGVWEHPSPHHLHSCFPGDREGVSSVRNRGEEQNRRRHLLFHQSDPARTARGGAGDLPHKASGEGAAGEWGAVRRTLTLLRCSGFPGDGHGLNRSPGEARGGRKVPEELLGALKPLKDGDRAEEKESGDELLRTLRSDLHVL